MEHLPVACPFSLFQIGGGNNDESPTQILAVPGLLSVLATNHVNGEVQGLNQLQAQYEKKYGPGNYIPNVFIQYWAMRVMAYLAALVLLSPCGACGCSAARPRKGQVVPAHRPLGVGPALPHEHGRVASDRERATTVDRPGADEDLPRRLTLGDVHRIWISLTVFVLLTWPGGGRRLPHDPLRRRTSPPATTRPRAIGEDGEPGGTLRPTSRRLPAPALIY